MKPEICMRWLLFLSGVLTSLGLSDICSGDWWTAMVELGLAVLAVTFAGRIPSGPPEEK